MHDAHTPEARTGRRWKRLRWLFVSLLAILAILIITIYYLPNIVSSERFRSLIEAKVSQTLQRPVYIKGLRWTWSDGISIHSFRIDDDSAFSKEPFFKIKNIVLKINLCDLFRRRLNVDFGIEGLNLRFIRNRDGVTNVETLLSAFPKGEPKKPEPTKTLDEWRKFSFSLPFEVQARVTLRDMAIRIEDRSQGRILTLGNVSFSAEINSLEQKSLSVRAASDIDINGTSLPPFRLDAKVQNLFTPKGKLALSDVSVLAEGSLPGMTIDVKCDLRTPEIRNKVQIDLPKLMKIVKPFLPPSLSDMDIAGVLGFTMDSSGDLTKNLRLTLAFTGQDLGLKGGPFKKTSVGPLRFTVRNEADVDLKSSKVTIKKGEVRFLERSVISWHGSIERANGGAIADVTVGPVSIDLDEVYRTARPFFPESVGISLEDLSRKNALTIGKIKLSGSAPKGLFTILLNDLALRVPAVNLKQKEMLLSLGNSSLSISNLRVMLKDLFPSEAAAAMSLHMEGLRFRGPKEVVVQRIAVPSLEISASEIRGEKGALFGVAGRIALREVQSLGVLSVPETAEIRDLKESLSMEVFLRPVKSVDVEVKEFKVDSPSLSVRNGRSVPTETPFSISTTMSMVLRKGTDYEADIKRLRSDIFMGKMLRAGMDLKAERWGFGGLRTEGRATADLSQVMQYIPQEMVKDVKLSGSAEMGWSFTGRLPGKEELEEMKEPEKALTALRDKDIVRDLDLDASFKALSVELTTAEGKRVTVSEISTRKPLRVVMEKGLKKVDLGGAVSASIQELPHLEKLKEPLRVAFDVSVGGEMLKTFTLTQSLRVSPLNLKQEARVSVSGLDKLLSKGQKGLSVELLEFIGGKANFSLELEKTDVSFVEKDLAVVGKITIGADMDLFPGREIGLRGWLQVPGLDLTYGKFINIRNLKSSLAVAKRYRLSIKEEAGASGPPPPYLSLQVLKPATESPRRASTEDPVLGRLMNDVRAKGPGLRTFSVESIHVDLKPLPVDIRHTGLDFNLEEGLPSIDFFQAEIMGGTVRGSLSIKRRNGTFFADFRSAFSGLNAQRLIPGASRGIRDEETEVSGMMSVALPLSTSIDRLLQDMEFEVEITHIGARALERMLYALDPYENNESIVQQRKLLRMGSVKWVTASVKDGMLFASGQVEVKGVKLELPKLERLNVGSLPGLGGYEKRLAIIGPTIEMLNILSANTVAMERDGKIRFLYKP
jgi:translocation and assembly module TamB